MDYEKKYKEALEWARKVIQGKVGFVLDEVLEKFPELKESEDERIRKALKQYFINSFQNNGVAAICGVHIKDVLAWLEKRVEQIPNYCHHEVDLSECSEEYRKAYYDGWNNCNQQHAQLEAEKKPTDKEMIEALHTEYEKGRADAITKFRKEWNEEDEEMLKYFNELLDYAFKSWSKFEGKAISALDWLKSLKDRIQSQSQWNPSDEDKLRVKQAIMYLSKKLSFESEKDDYNFREGQIKWLKSLKERYAWKPSDEQMKGIECAIRTLRHQLNVGDKRLDSLYNDLKKLK